MIASDMVRAAIAILFHLRHPAGRTWLLFLLSGLLMFASPFFTSGRAAILPSIATKEELHTANSLTQLTQWTTLAVGSFLGGASVSGRLPLSFLFNASHFFFPHRAFRTTGRFPAASAPLRSGAQHESLTEDRDLGRGTNTSRAALHARLPLILGIGLVAVGWATGGGAATNPLQPVRRAEFPARPGRYRHHLGFAGIGLIIGSLIRPPFLPRTSASAPYKRTIRSAYILHGGSYSCSASRLPSRRRCLLIGLSRAAVGVSAVSTPRSCSVTSQTNIADGFSPPSKPGPG